MKTEKKILVFKIFTFPILVVILILLGLTSLIKSNIKISILNVGRIGHLALNTEVSLREEQVSNCKKKLILLAPPLSDINISNKQLVKMFARNPNVYQSYFFYTFVSIWHKYFIKAPLFFKTHHKNNEYDLFHNAKPSISFSSREIIKGDSFLNRFKIKNYKYVCIFLRDSAYLSFKENKNQDMRSCRDADIDTTIKAIKYLISKGYYVVRIGSHAKNRVSLSHNMFIDYPFTDEVNDFNDVYLIANASMLIGNASGICDVATMFDVPRLGVNMVPFLHAPFGKKSMFIPKKISCNDDIVGYYDDKVKRIGDNFACSKVHNIGCKYIDNSEDEILSAVVNFIKYVDDEYTLDSTFSQEMDSYYEYYIHGSEFDGVKTPLCPSWYNNNTKLYR